MLDKSYIRCIFILSWCFLLEGWYRGSGRDTVLGEETDEIESLKRELTRRRRKGCRVVGVESLKLGEVAVKGRNILSSYRPECTDFQCAACIERIRYRGQSPVR